MGLLELFLIAVGLSMDAFAVSVCKGLSVRTLKAKHAVICGLYFGGFQLLMPLIGFALGVRFQSLITSIDHWIAFVLLGLIGFLQVDIVPAVSFIGATTFVLSCIGVKIGHVFGTKYKSRAELFGGIVLILMGLKILLEHLGFLG